MGPLRHAIQFVCVPIVDPDPHRTIVVFEGSDFFIAVNIIFVKKALFLLIQKLIY